MFSSQIGRVARASTSLSSTTCTAVHRSPACLAAAASSKTLSQPRRQQRRYSSSKPSCPSDGDSKGAGPAAPAQAAGASQPSRPAAGKSSNGRKAGARKAKEASEEARLRASDEAFDKLPSVPSTHHLHPHDITLSSFFSLHRPISLTSALPPSTDIHTFESIFDVKPTSKATSKNPADVIYTLASTIDSLDAKTQPEKTKEEADLRWEIIQESVSNTPDNVKHLDGAPRQKTIEQLLSQLKPFSAPPPPLSSQYVVHSKKSTNNDRKSDSAAANQLTHSHEPVSEKQFKTTIIVTESTNSSGAKYYTAQTSPMVQITNHPSQDLPTIQEPAGRRQTFLERMHERQIQYQEYREDRAEQKREEGAMHALSVKRQRKLKMKKHKYKKLMKRTRNLRRRLDRN